MGRTNDTCLPYFLYIMFYPQVTFRRNAQRDIEALRAFIKDADYSNGRNLDWAVFSKYPHLKTQFDQNSHYKMKSEKTLRNFVYEIYRAKQVVMDLALTRHKKRWIKV